MNDLPSISVITVVYNGAPLIEKTIKSVLSQTYLNIEYIIIDGGSKDGTLEICNKYSNQLAHLISEKDKGIYDAMNKGLLHATGEYCFFLNAGDEFYNDAIIACLFNKYGNKPDAIYGSTELITPNGQVKKTTEIPKTLTWKKMWQGMIISHQGIIFRRRNIQKYNINYKYVADHEWIIAGLKKCNNVQNSEEIICKYLLGGLTDGNLLKCWKERLSIVKTFYNPVYVYANYCLFLKEFAKIGIKKILLLS